MSVFKDSLPIVKENEINFAIDSVYQGKWETLLSESAVWNLYECACFASLWSCLASGALIQGNIAEAEMYAMKAVLANSLYDISDLPPQSTHSSTLVRAEILLALLNRLSGDQEKAKYHFITAEKLSVTANDGCIRVLLKAFTNLGMISSHQILESLHSLFFSEEDLDEFPFDAKIYHKWRAPFFYHVAFEKKDWAMKYECYKELLLAENYLLNKWNRSPLNWLQIQTLLMALEAGHLQMFEQAAQRARQFASRLLERVQKVSAIISNVSSDGHNEFLLTLDLMAFIFFKMKDFQYFEIIRTVWNSLPTVRTEKPLSDLSEMVWDGFTENVLRNILRAHIESMFCKIKEECVGECYTTLHSVDQVIGNCL